MHIRRRPDHSTPLFLKRTLAAQLHALGGAAMIAGAYVLLPLAEKAGVVHFWACLSFLVTGITVFMVSSTYHFLTDGFEGSEELHLFFENLDHFSIYLFIAGTYTPFLMNAVSKPWQIPLLIGIWVVAILGIAYTWSKPSLPELLQRRGVYTSIFVAMGLMLLVRMGEITTRLSTPRLSLLVGGGVAYIVGAVFYATRRPKLFEGVFGFHELWHLMVLLGAGLHYLLIFSFYSAI